MTHGESQLRQELIKAIYSDRLLGQDFDQAKHTVKLVLETIKSGEYFVHTGTIREIQETDWLDYGDDYVSYTVYVEDVSEEDE